MLRRASSQCPRPGYQQNRIRTRAHQYSRGLSAPGPQEIRDHARRGNEAIRASTRAVPILVVITSSLRRVATICAWPWPSMQTRNDLDCP